jgi:hypothetical protein
MLKAGPVKVRTIQPALEGRRDELGKVAAASAKNYQVYGRVDFNGSGESTFDANFPVWFVEAPQLSFGGELGGNQILVAGNYPRVNVMVRTWMLTERSNYTFYTGAQFVLVIEGPAEMTGVAHWQIEGVGLSNPIVEPDHV